jgi:hypothetical protein
MWDPQLSNPHGLSRPVGIYNNIFLVSLICVVINKAYAHIIKEY